MANEDCRKPVSSCPFFFVFFTFFCVFLPPPPSSRGLWCRRRERAGSSGPEQRQPAPGSCLTAWPSARRRIRGRAARCAASPATRCQASELSPPGLGTRPRGVTAPLGMVGPPRCGGRWSEVAWGAQLAAGPGCGGVWGWEQDTRMWWWLHFAFSPLIYGAGALMQLQHELGMLVPEAPCPKCSQLAARGGTWAQGGVGMGRRGHGGG